MYFIARFCVTLAMLFRFRLKVEGRENIPRQGAFVLCANHIHALDPLALAIAVPRRLSFMGKKELFANPLGGRFFRILGAFPVDRGGADMSAYRMAIKRLAAGHGLLVFSQGTRMQVLNIADTKGGAALFSVKAKVPVVPVGISSSYRWFAPVTVRFGAPVSLEAYHGARLASQQVDDIMQGLMAQVETLASQKESLPCAP